MSTMGVVRPAARASRIMASVHFTVTPFSSAPWLALAMVPPSASGSEKGMPTSMSPTPQRCMASMAGTVVASVG